MPETRQRAALEVLRRLDDLAKEGHLVVMGPQDLTDPLWDDIEAVLRATPASDGGEVRERWRGWLGAAAEIGRESDAGYHEIACDVLNYIDRDDPTLLSGSGTPQGEGERGLIMRAMLETFPWSPDIRQEHFERAADAVIAALRSEAQGEMEIDEPAREASEARWWASEAIRAARRGEGGVE